MQISRQKTCHILTVHDLPTEKKLIAASNVCTSKIWVNLSVAISAQENSARLAALRASKGLPPVL